ncbi:FAD:protein FMN transferase [Bacillus sp. JJ1609]|uniref:FAD:protein FMN transferase n=1 Tax=Bacillus sp. JJ1609 TaxID=3122977 RepID=UPI003000B290
MKTEFKAMNSTVLLEGIEPIFQMEVKRWLYEFEQKVSRFIENNPLSFINKSPLDVPVYLDETLADLLERSLKLSRKAGYYVHPFVGEAMKSIGYTSSFHDNYQPVFKEGNHGEKIFLKEPIDRLSKRWLIKKQDFSFDFGGFGKGYIVDQTKKQLLLRKGHRFLVNAGGDLAVAGTHQVGIEHPILIGKDMMRLTITDCALATSGKNHRRWMKDEAEFHHILNGRTGKPASNGVLQASVIAKTTMEAETAAKILCILPFDQAKALLYKNFRNIAYIVYFDDDQLVLGGDDRLYESLKVSI